MAKVNYDLFSDLLAQAIRDRGAAFLQTKKSRTWFRNKVAEMGSRKYTQKMLEQERTRTRANVEVGRMYFFGYDPKWKKKLPYYDRFPMIFPFNVKKDRFWGINLHYLPHKERAKLMDALHDLANNDRYDKNTKLAISYEILKESSKTKWFRPCVKEYLKSHVMGNFMRIESSEWDIALFLPFERFQKKSKEFVWEESLKMVGGKSSKGKSKSKTTKSKTKKRGQTKLAKTTKMTKVTKTAKPKKTTKAANAKKPTKRSRGMGRR